MTATFFPPMPQTCNILTVTRNEYSDYVTSGSVSSACRFEEITDITRGNHSVGETADAIVHLPASTTATLESLITYNGVTYQIEKFVTGKRLYDDIVQFYKAYLKIARPS